MPAGNPRTLACASFQSITADGDLVLPHRSGGQVVAVEGVQDAVLVGDRQQLVPGRVGGEGGRRPPVGVEDRRRERQLPGALVLQRGGVERHDRLRLGLRVVVERSGRHEDRVGRRVIGRSGPYAPADLPVGHEVVGVDDLPLLRARDRHLEQLALEAAEQVVERLRRSLPDERTRQVFDAKRAGKSEVEIAASLGCSTRMVRG